LFFHKLAYLCGALIKPAGQAGLSKPVNHSQQTGRVAIATTMIVAHAKIQISLKGPAINEST
jgi:isocitrate dehydrogenase kinase/phosphatase